MRSSCKGPSQADVDQAKAGAPLSQAREDFWIGLFLDAKGEAVCWKARSLGAIGAVDTFNAGLAKR